MKRRIFLIMMFYVLTRSLSAKTITPTYWKIIESVYQHLFPKTSKFSGALDLNMIDFIKIITKDKYFDKDDFALLIKGAKKLYKVNNNFINLSIYEKEKVLRKIEQTSFGQNWLSTLMYYGFEAMLSDPIYGGNKNQKGWRSLNHNSGFPRPKVKYGI